MVRILNPRPGKSVQPDFKVISDSIRYDQILKITRILLGIIIQELRKVTVYIRFYGFLFQGLLRTLRVR